MMSDEERLQKWLEEHEGGDLCHYCIYDDDCPHGITCYGGPPIEPYCCGREPGEYLDTESILGDMKGEESPNVSESFQKHIADRFLKKV